MSCRRRGWAKLVASTVVLGVALGGCGGPPTRLPKTHPRYSLESGRGEFARGHWLEAQTHLKHFLDTHPGDAAADSAQFLVARALFESKSYPEAAVEFGVLPREYPRSLLREEAGYCECLSVFKQMRPSQLDPTFANRAASCFQDFLLRYPNTTWRQAGQERLQEIDDRLSEKQYRLGVMFARMNRPTAACVYLEEVVSNYPRSRWVAPSLYTLGKCRQQMGEPEAARRSLERVITDYPESEWAREARRLLPALGVSAPATAAPADSAAPRPQP